MSAHQNILLTAGLVLSMQSGAARLQLDSDQLTGQALTLYNQGPAQVENQYSLPALALSSRVEVSDLSNTLIPESLLFTHPGTLLSQGYNKQTFSYNQLLNDALGQTVTLARTNPATGEESRQQVVLKALDAPYALVETTRGIENIPLNGPWRFIFSATKPETPYAYFTSAGTNSADTLQLRYQTQGLNWHMQYQLELDSSAQHARLQGLASIKNSTRQAFTAAPLQLLAGEISTPAARPERSAGLMVMASDSAIPAQRQPLQGQHLYTLNGPIEIPAQQLLQLPLFDPVKLSTQAQYSHEFRLYPRPDSQQYTIKPDARLKLSNSHSEPLPAGQVRITRRDQHDRLQLVGHDTLPNLAPQQSVELSLGRAFDMSLKRYQTSYSKTYQGALIGYRVEVNNAAAQAHTLKLVASFPNEWNIKRSSLNQADNLGGAAHWQLTVPAGGKRTLDFQVEISNR